MAKKPEILNTEHLSQFDLKAATRLAGEMVAIYFSQEKPNFDAIKEEVERQHELHAQLGGATSIFPHAILLAKTILKLEAPKA